MNLPMDMRVDHLEAAFRCERCEGKGDFVSGAFAHAVIHFPIH